MTTHLLQRLSDILDVPAGMHPDLGHVFDALDGARVWPADDDDQDRWEFDVAARWTPPETLTEDSDPPLRSPLPLAGWDEACQPEIGGFTDADLQEGVPFVIDLANDRTMVYDGDAWSERLHGIDVPPPVDPADRDAVLAHVRANRGTGPTLPRLDGGRAR